jgi:purine-nucleoside phosphorylase
MDQLSPHRAAAVAADQMRTRLGTHDVAVVLGSGWSGISRTLGATVEQIEVAALAGAPVPGVPGHEGTLRSVSRRAPDGSSVAVLVAAGRAHLYEGHDAASVVHVVRAAVLSGCRTVVLTNGAGSLRSDVGVGETVVLSDQLNLTGTNPLCGPPPPGGPGERFADLSDLYSGRCRERLRAALPDAKEGVYAGVLGGSFETPAEIRMMRGLGADLVGMSTVLEAIAAHQLGAEVVGISLVTNFAAGMQPSVDHQEVLEAGRRSAGQLAEVLGTVLDVCVADGAPGDGPDRRHPR